MKNSILVVLSIVLLSCLACQENPYEAALPGEWQAHDFLISSEPTKMDISRLAFSFDANGRYTYQGSNLTTKEAGLYRLKGPVLYTTDTLAENRIEKAVKIGYLKNDTLQFLMNLGGIDQEIHLHKTK